MVIVPLQLDRVFAGMRLPRAAFYERVSTDEQSERDTIRAQDRALHKRYDPHFAEDAAEPWTFVATFRDDGYSGTLPWDERPEGRRLMQLIRRGEIDIVCVARSDRLARDRTIANGIAEEFAAREIRIESTTEHIDLTTPAGRLHFAILCDFSHYERELIRDRTMGGRRTHAEAGEFINGPVPFGYDIESGRLVPSKRPIPQLSTPEQVVTEADLVVQIFKRCAKGESLLSIMRWLQTAGVPSTKRYYNKKTERYKELVWPRWQHSRLQDMVSNPIYYGERTLKYNRAGSTKYKKIAEPVTQAVPALITRALFGEAKVARQGHVSNFNTPREEHYTYLLTSRLVCGSCGFNMIGNFQKGDRYHPTPRLIYQCSRARGRTNARRTGVVCPAPVYVSGFKLEEFVKLKIDWVVANDAQVRAALLARQAEQQGKDGQDGQQKKVLRQRLAGLERGRANLRALVNSGELTAEEFRTESAENARLAAEARHELELLDNEETLAEALLTQMQSAEKRLEVLKAVWTEVRDGARAPLREFLQDLVQKITVTKEREIKMTLLFDSGYSDKAYLCDYPSIGTSVFELLGSVSSTTRQLEDVPVG